jgi:hypothetical protein
MLKKHVKEMGWELREVYQDEGVAYEQNPKPPIYGTFHRGQGVLFLQSLLAK